MGIVGTGFSMSLDGFVAGPNDDVSQLFAWCGKGDTEYKTPGGRVVFKVASASAELEPGAEPSMATNSQAAFYHRRDYIRRYGGLYGSATLRRQDRPWCASWLGWTIPAAFIPRLDHNRRVARPQAA